MKLTSMIALAVKWTFNERIETFVELGKVRQEERYKDCLYDALYSGDTARYNKLIATGVADC